MLTLCVLLTCKTATAGYGVSETLQDFRVGNQNSLEGIKALFQFSAVPGS